MTITSKENHSLKYVIDNKLQSVFAHNKSIKYVPGTSDNNDCAPTIDLLSEIWSYFTACPIYIKKKFNDLIDMLRMETPKTLAEYASTSRTTGTPASEAFTNLGCLIASNPETPAAVLHTLSKLKCPKILERIAENPHTTKNILAVLAVHPSADVRTAAADNSNISLPHLWLLAHDINPDVRYSQAENQRTPIPILGFLSEDENPYVATRARRTLDSQNHFEIGSSAFHMEGDLLT